MSLIEEICVIGFLSRLGGADTELDHQIYVWQNLGVKVHLVHTGPMDHNCHLTVMRGRVCIVHELCEWRMCAGKEVIYYCIVGFLDNLVAIRSVAKSTTFVNCMSWIFENEKAIYACGIFDFFLYQTEHAIEK